jgi:hypothetical protein
MSLTKPSRYAFAKADLYQVQRAQIDSWRFYTKESIPEVLVELAIKEGTKFSYFSHEDCWKDECGLFQIPNYNCWVDYFTEPVKIITADDENDSKKNLYNIYDAIGYVSGLSGCSNISDPVEDVFNWLDWRLSLSDFQLEEVEYDGIKQSLFELGINAIEKYINSGEEDDNEEAEEDDEN